MEYIPYTYLIGWSKLDLWYYGVERKHNRSKTANPNNLWTTYFTSSKAVRRLRQEHGEPDIVQVRKTFRTAEQAFRWEQTVLKRMRVVDSERWLNRAIYGLKDFSNDPERIRNILKTRKSNGQPWHDEQTKAKIGASKAGRSMKLSVEERNARRQRFSDRNLKDESFIALNRAGRERRWKKDEERHAQAERMRRCILDQEAQQRRIEKQRQPAARERARKDSKARWASVEAAMREGHERFRNDPVRQAEHRRKALDALYRRRGWRLIVVDEREFETIVACARHLGRSEKWVRKAIREGVLVTR